MNWYKKAQTSNISIEDITNTINAMICRTPGLISEEDIENAFNRYNSYVEMDDYDVTDQPITLPKAAQTTTKLPNKIKRNPLSNSPSESRLFDPRFKSKVLQLFETGLGLQNMAKQLGISSKEVNQILNEYFPNKEEKKKYLQAMYAKKVLDSVSEWKRDLIADIVSAASIAREMNIQPEVIRSILKDNNIDLNALTMERKFLVEDKIAEIVSNATGPLTTEKIAKIFKEQTGYPLNSKTVAVVVNYRNLRISGRKKQNSLFVGLKNFLGDFGHKIEIAVEMDPTRLSYIIDEYVRRYGSSYGFEDEKDKRILKINLMHKLQLRDRVMQQAELGNALKTYIPTNQQSKIIELMQRGLTSQEISETTGLKPQDIEKFIQLYQVKYAPNKLDESHPSYFLGKNQE